MLRTIACTNCDKGKHLPFELDWEVDDSHCDKCGQYKGKTIRYHFCSSKCLKEWVLKFVGHKHNWKQHNIIIGPYQHGDEWLIMKRCSLCFTEKEFKATKKEIKERQKRITEIMGDEDES